MGSELKNWKGDKQIPKGEPNVQTKATQKYQTKAGYMTKGFKLKREVVREFEQVCSDAGVSQASMITKFMMKYIEENR